MTRILIVLIFISSNLFSQVSESFNKSDSLFIYEYNIFRKSFGLNGVTPSLKLRREVTNIHMQYLFDIKVDKSNKENWAHHPKIMNTNENLSYSSGYSHIGYSYLSIIYSIDLFYTKNKIKVSGDFFEPFYKNITNKDGGIDNQKLDEFKKFIYENIKDFWIKDNVLEVHLNILISTYRKDMYTKTHEYVDKYLGMKNLFVMKMKFDIKYLFNKNNVDYTNWISKEILYRWYRSEGHREILLKKYKHISIYITIKPSGQEVALFNIQDENIISRVGK